MNKKFPPFGALLNSGADLVVLCSTTNAEPITVHKHG